jgi:hypothetical protein
MKGIRILKCIPCTAGNALSCVTCNVGWTANNSYTVFWRMILRLPSPNTHAVLLILGSKEMDMNSEEWQRGRNLK